MSDRPQIYSIRSQAEGRRVLRSLQQAFPTKREPSLKYGKTYHDTFDGLAWRDEGVIWQVEQSPAPSLYWAFRDGRVRHRMPAAEMPAFVWELPSGAFRDELAAVIDVRRLMPVVRIEVTEQKIAVLDKRRKTVARLVLSHGQVHGPDAGGDPRRLPVTLQLHPLRGFADAAQRLCIALETEHGLQPTDPCELVRALRVLDRKPGGTRSKFRVQVTPELPAAEAARKIYRVLLKTILRNEDGVRREIDTEFLHDFRVAVRRTRSALGQIRKVFPEPELAHFRGEFAWLGRVTGLKRDLDVYLLKMPDYQTELGPEQGRALLPLVDYLDKLRGVEQGNLVRELESERYRKLLTDWRAFLEQRPAEGSGPANADRPISAVAAERIWKRYRKVRGRGRAIEDGSPVEDFHVLRIECKKLRYLLEFFASLHPPEAIRALVDPLKQLQDNLGDLNDLVVQQTSLDGFSRGMEEQGEGSAPTAVAIGQLVARLSRRQRAERRRFAECFAPFDSPASAERYRALFKMSPDGVS